MSPFAFLSEFCFFATRLLLLLVHLSWPALFFFLFNTVFLSLACIFANFSRVPSDPFIAITRSGFSVNSNLRSFLTSFFSVWWFHCFFSHGRFSKRSGVRAWFYWQSLFLLMPATAVCRAPKFVLFFTLDIDISTTFLVSFPEVVAFPLSIQSICDPGLSSALGLNKYQHGNTQKKAHVLKNIASRFSVFRVSWCQSEEWIQHIYIADLFFPVDHPFGLPGSSLDRSFEVDSSISVLFSYCWGSCTEYFVFCTLFSCINWAGCSGLCGVIWLIWLIMHTMHQGIKFAL